MKAKPADPAFRYQMMERGYMNKKELAQFIGCGYKKARSLFEAISQDVKKEGLEAMDPNLVLTKRVIEYLGLTNKQVIDAYERSRTE